MGRPMGYWNEVHDNLPGHPKVRKLALKLSIDIVATVGVLICLWLWGLRYTEDGILEGIDPEDIALGAYWQGDPQQFLEALIACRWVDTDPLRIHEWELYAGRLVELRRKRSEAGKKGNEVRWGNAGDGPSIAERSQSDGGEIAPDRTQPQPEPFQTKTSTTTTGAVVVDETILQNIRKHLLKVKGLKVFNEDARDGAIEYAIKNYVRHIETGGEEIRQPLNWSFAVAKEKAKELDVCEHGNPRFDTYGCSHCDKAIPEPAGDVAEGGF